MNVKQLKYFIQNQMKAGEEVSVTDKQALEINSILRFLNESPDYQYEFSHNFTRIKKTRK